MNQYRKSLSNALFFSMALHTAILGSAIAFAHYGGLLLGQDLRTISVLLVNGRGMAEAGAAAGPSRTRRTQPRELVHSEAQKDVLPEQRNDHHNVVPSSPASHEDGVAPNALSGTTAEGGSSGSADSDAGSPAIGFSKEQWQQLHIAIERAKNYPRFARERGIEGTVLVRFKVLPTGEIERVDILKSSGSDILDTASVRTVYRAAPMPYVNGWVEVPMSYVLK